MMTRPRKRGPRPKLNLDESRQIVSAIYALTTRGKHARSHIEQELNQIIDAAKFKLADYHKGVNNRKRHGRRTAKDLAARAEWFAKNRREVRDEPKQVAAAAEEREMTLQEYWDDIHKPITPAHPVKTKAQIDAEIAQRIDREIGREKGEKWALDD